MKIDRYKAPSASHPKGKPRRILEKIKKRKDKTKPATYRATQDAYKAWCEKRGIQRIRYDTPFGKATE